MAIISFVGGTNPNIPRYNRKTVTDPIYNARLADAVILIDTTSNSITVNLPTAVTNDKKIFFLKNITNNFNAIITAFGSEEIDTGLTGGGNSHTLFGGQAITIISDNVNWWIL